MLQPVCTTQESACEYRCLEEIAQKGVTDLFRCSFFCEIMTREYDRAEAVTWQRGHPSVGANTRPNGECAIQNGNGGDDDTN